jgi:hypothetical protein
LRQSVIIHHKQNKMKKEVEELDKAIQGFIKAAEKEKGQGKTNAIVTMMVSETADRLDGNIFGQGEDIVKLILSICEQNEQNKYLIIQAAANLLTTEQLNGILDEKKKLINN